jgi:hypothetical protein
MEQAVIVLAYAVSAYLLIPFFATVAAVIAALVLTASERREENAQ